MFFCAFSSPLTTRRPLLPTFRTQSIPALSIRLAHDIAAELVWKMRGARKAALANSTDKSKLARAVATSVRDFVHVATSNQKSMLDAMDAINSVLANIGAGQNVLDYTTQNLKSTVVNLRAAESTIRDVDMAEEMATFTKNNILSQAAQAMLSQANQGSQGVLSLLR